MCMYISSKGTPQTETGCQMLCFPHRPPQLLLMKFSPMGALAEQSWQHRGCNDSDSDSDSDTEPGQRVPHLPKPPCQELPCTASPAQQHQAICPL